MFALGALDGHEREEFKRIWPPAVESVEAHSVKPAKTLNSLPRDAHGPISPPPAVKTRLLEQIGANDKVVPMATARAHQAKSWRKITGILAAGHCRHMIGGTYYRFQYEPRHTIYSSVIDLLRDPATRDSPLYGAGPTPRAKGRFLWNESGEGHIFVSDLPAAPEGKMYAVWTIAEQSAPRYVGTIQTDAAGKGGLHINAARSDRPVETFAVTVEPIGSTAAPTGPMVLISKSS